MKKTIKPLRLHLKKEIVSQLSKTESGAVVGGLLAPPPGISDFCPYSVQKSIQQDTFPIYQCIG